MVQKELKITLAQVAGLKEVEEQRDFLRLQRPVSEETRDLEKAREARQQISREADPGLGRRLDPNQRARLEQIRFQAEGPMAFAPGYSGAPES